MGEAGHKRENRNISFELMRIVCMFMVVMLHYLNSTDRLISVYAPLDSVHIAGTAIEMLCIVCVNAFVLLFGYYLCRQDFKPKRLVRLELEILFYALLVPFVLKLAGQPVIGDSVYDLRYYFLPVMSGNYWFMTAYAVMYLFIPVLNAAVKSLSGKALRNALFGLLIPFSLVKSVCPLLLSFDRYGYDFGWFIVLYLTGAYIALHGIPFLSARKKGTLVYLLMAAFSLLLTVLIKLVSLSHGGMNHPITIPNHYNFLPVYLSSLGFFAVFMHLDLSRIPDKAKKAVTFVSSSALAVYLIHGHIDLIDSWAYYLTGIFGTAPESLFFILHGLIMCLFVFVVSIAVDKIRILLFNGIHFLCCRVFHVKMRQAGNNGGGRA